MSIQDTTANTQGAGGLGKLKSWVVGATGVLVVLPALFNAGVDIYNLVLDIPKTEAEAVNADLFKEYFGKPPLFSGAIPVKTDLGEVEMELEVHGVGDILVRYGQRSQWFASPLRTEVVSLPFLRSAHAQDAKAAVGSGAYYQLDRMKGGALLRERYFTDGKKESYVVDPLTGDWSKPTVETYDAVPDGSAAETKTFRFPVIDLTKDKI